MADLDDLTRGINADDWVRTNEQYRLAELLRKVADGRREYAAKAPAAMAEVLEQEARTLETAALIVLGNIRVLYSLLPSWRWTPEMNARLRGPAGDALDEVEADNRAGVEAGRVGEQQR